MVRPLGHIFHNSTRFRPFQKQVFTSAQGALEELWEVGVV